MGNAQSAKTGSSTYDLPKRNFAASVDALKEKAAGTVIEASDDNLVECDRPFPFENLVFEGGSNKLLVYCGVVRVSFQSYCFINI